MPSDAASAQLSFTNRYPAIVPATFAGGLALVGALDLPYGFYFYFRTALSSAAVLLAFFAIRSERPAWLALFVPICILWTPVAWIHLSRGTWQVLDVIVAGFLIAVGFAIPAPPEQKNDDDGTVLKRMVWWKMTAIALALTIFFVMAFSGSGSGNPDCVTTYDRVASCE
ncbi:MULTISPECIES: DUF6804 family protein [Cryobacterium]|uniref:Uncharacterized protein n=1 Tax=Cryobacterium glucosi TaxID=1259175 RepID=A0ABY2ITV6_9MICO|nr:MULTISPECIES: DUF6804 family protein [Cryobacterium]TFB96679.1 hypothetical protein E3O39_11540 [Cryobacterium sp. MDB2-A-1]TFC12963.1 hypothetical protein E3O35_08700 [Cryobacterium sp. MDB2-A-2]TFC22682.1 hypothetical protein E3O46_04395 [Cryobacterium glucosi]TFC23976.1 hypothetical protein E3O51_00180 [Cryobacterium sp. MDB2-10]